MSIKLQLKKSMIVLVAFVALMLVACTPTTGGSLPVVDGNDGGIEDVVDGVLEEVETAVPPTAEPEKPEELDVIIPNITWILQSYAGQPVILDTDVTVEFGADGQLSGSAGCNNFFGSYQLDGTSLTINGVGSTEMWCEGLMDQESAFLSMLMNAVSVTIDENGLTIQTTDGDLVFAEAVDTTLEGTEWQLNAIAEENGVVSMHVDSEITIQFADGAVNGNAGCNQFFGSYTIEGNSITITDIGATEMFCDEAHNQRETQFLAGLSRIAAFQIDRTSLRLLDEDGNEVLFLQVSMGEQPETSVAPADEIIVAPETENGIPERYIVMLSPSLFNEAGETVDGKTVAVLADELIAPTGGKVTTVLEIINGFVAEGLSKEDVTTLAKNPLVMSIEQDRMVSVDPVEMP